MKYNIKDYLVVIFTFLIFTSLLLYVIIQKRDEKRSRFESDLELAQLTDLNRQSRQREIQHYNSIGISVPLLRDSLIKRPETLFIRFSDKTCNVCYNQSVNELIKQTVKNGIDLIILGSFTNNYGYRELLKELNLTGFEAYNNLNTKDIIPADLICEPYCFTINQHGEINSLLFFDKYQTDTLKTRTYVHMIKRIIESDFLP